MVPKREEGRDTDDVWREAFCRPPPPAMPPALACVSRIIGIFAPVVKDRRRREFLPFMLHGLSVVPTRLFRMLFSLYCNLSKTHFAIFKMDLQALDDQV